ncbi:spermidine/putrescine ABC transporter substrate-binding protein [Deltaproteobacteria bacterium OttesenSCG-928-M10]|nr:spermidine/putrescine ABC transporter substrate-binding protein [Deltaproteobacteria bacterium OttesenSCG-928-M10]
MKLHLQLLCLILIWAAGPAPAEELLILASARIMPPSVMEAFEKEFDIKIRLEYFESSEALSAYLESRPRGDLALLRGYYIQGLIDSGQVAPLDHRLLPNLKNLDERALESPADPGARYSVPFLVGTLGILYRGLAADGAQPDWDYIFGPESSPIPFARPDQYRDALGMALISLGHSFNSVSAEAIGQAAERLRGLKNHPTFMGFMPPETILRYLREKFIHCAATYNNLAALAISEDPGLDYVAPDRNRVVWVYAFTLNAASPRAGAAHKWLNYTLRPEVAAAVSTWNKATTPNTAALPLLPPEIRNNPVIYPPSTVWSGAERPTGAGEAEKLYIEHWSGLK